MNIIEVENLSFSYPEAQVLQELSLTVEQGGFLAVAGPNGAGKSTLLSLLCGWLKPTAGSIRVEGKAVESYHIEELARRIAVVRQEFVPVFGFSVTETVLMARTMNFDQFGFESRADREMVKEALEVTDTARFAPRPLGTLSGGERQRVFIARALAQNTGILLLDEPTSHLDLRHQVGIYDLLKRAQLEKRKTIVAVTHDINLAAQYADLVLLLGPDRNYKVGPPGEVFCERHIKEVFGVTGFTARVGKEQMFLPLGKFARDRDIAKNRH